MATLTDIQWTVYGKVWSVTKANGDRVDYLYGPDGNRVRKQVRQAGKLVSATWYARDASGNPMAIYTKTYEDQREARSPSAARSFRPTSMPLINSVQKWADMALMRNIPVLLRILLSLDQATQLFCLKRNGLPMRQVIMPRSHTFIRRIRQDRMNMTKLAYKATNQARPTRHGKTPLISLMTKRTVRPLNSSMIKRFLFVIQGMFLLFSSELVLSQDRKIKTVKGDTLFREVCEDPSGSFCSDGFDQSYRHYPYFLTSLQDDFTSSYRDSVFIFVRITDTLLRGLRYDYPWSLDSLFLEYEGNVESIKFIVPNRYRRAINRAYRSTIRNFKKEYRSKFKYDGSFSYRGYIMSFKYFDGGKRKIDVPDIYMEKEGAFNDEAHVFYITEITSVRPLVSETKVIDLRKRKKRRQQKKKDCPISSSAER